MTATPPSARELTSCLVVSPVAGCIVVAMFVTPYYVFVNINTSVALNYLFVIPGCLSFRAKRGISVSPEPNTTPTLAPIFARPAAVYHAAQEEVAHFSRDMLGIGIDARVMPGINPIHHAKQAQHRDARGELQSPVAFQFIQKAHADAVVFAFDGRHFRGKSILDRKSVVWGTSGALGDRR